MPATIDVIDAHNATVTVNAPSDRGAGPTTTTTVRTITANDQPVQTVAQGNTNQGGTPTTAWYMQGATGGNPLPVNGTVTVNGIPTTAADRGQGAATANTARVTIDNTQVSPLVKGSVPTLAGGNNWLSCGAGATTTLQVTAGAVGDYLEGIVCVVDTPATSQVQIKDGTGTAVEVLPANVAFGIGTQPIPFGYTSKLGAWQIICGAGVHVIASGAFS